MSIGRFGLDGDFAGIGELDGVADEINQDLGQAAAVTMTRWQFGGNFHLERELLVRGQRLQRAADGLGNVLNRVVGEFEFELAGLDLRQIQHVIDESEQMLAVGLKTFEYAMHLLGRLTVSPVRHQFGIAQDGVEWRVPSRISGTPRPDRQPATCAAAANVYSGSAKTSGMRTVRPSARTRPERVHPAATGVDVATSIKACENP